MKRVMRFVGNRPEPEKELFGFEEVIHRLAWPTVDFSKVKDILNPLFSDFEEKAQPGSLCRSLREDTYGSYFNITMGPLLDSFFTPSSTWLTEKPKEPPALAAESEFEVNLTEALVGWRVWMILSGRISSYNEAIVWNPDWPLQAQCKTGYRHELPPHEHCSCGIYAADSIDNTPNEKSDPEIVLGEVYGWGRYVRGSEGWRSQFAYPKSFHLRSDQAHHVDSLRKYHVPIFIEQPMKIYDPSEDGYENRQDNQSWNLGAGPESFAQEDRDTGEDDQD